MTRELLVVLPHSLGREEARRRVAAAVDHGRQQFSGFVSAGVAWPNEDRADLDIGALGQTVKAQVDVEDREVRVRVYLPWLLASFADRLSERIRHVGGDALRIGHDPKAGGGA